MKGIHAGLDMSPSFVPDRQSCGAPPLALRRESCLFAGSLRFEHRDETGFRRQAPDRKAASKTWLSTSSKSFASITPLSAGTFPRAPLSAPNFGFVLSFRHAKGAYNPVL